jgi:hypothetical protein
MPDHMSSDNKVCELTTVCLPWQQWAETSIWFVDLWQPLYQWCLLLSVFWRAIARMLELELNFLLNLEKVEAKSERC